MEHDLERRTMMKPSHMAVSINLGVLENGFQMEVSKNQGS